MAAFPFGRVVVSVEIFGEILMRDYFYFPTPECQMSLISAEFAILP